LRVWLDDVREAPEGWVHVRAPEEAIDLLRSGEVTEISLDHDLGLVDENGRETTGYDVLTWIENELGLGRATFQIPTIHVHSANAAVYIRMEQAITSIYRLSGTNQRDSGS
jgi:hypothetical protein